MCHSTWWTCKGRRGRAAVPCVVMNWSSCGTDCDSPSRPATSRPEHGCGACTPSRRARSSPPSSGRRPRLPPRPVSQLGSCKHPPARLLSRNIAWAANASRRHSPNGPTTARRCGLAGDRDAISVTLAAYLVFEDPADPSTAAVDFAAAKGSSRCPATRALLGRSLNFVASGRQDARSESTAKNALAGSSVEETWRTPSPSAMVARRNSARRCAQPRMRPAFLAGPRRTGRKREPTCPAWRRENCRHCGTALRASGPAGQPRSDSVCSAFLFFGAYRIATAA